MMKIEDLLEFLGINKEYGYRYLKEALYIIKRKNLKPSEINLSVNIYPILAKKFGVSFAAVETACRRTLIRSFNKGNEEEYYVLFKTKRYMTTLQFLKKSRKLIIKTKK